MRQDVRDLLESLPTQADAPKPRRQQCKEMPPLREMLRQYAGSLHAHSYARLASRLHCVQQKLLATVVTPGTHALAHRRKTIRLRTLRKGLRRPVKPPSAHADALRIQTLYL